MEVVEKLLTVNPYSRPGIKIGRIKKIVVHWVGNANTTAMANRNYFESLKVKKIYASSHYIIGLEGEVIRCVPENEIAYHAKQANSYSIGIECCHPDWEGKFNQNTYQKLLLLLVDLCKRYKLKPTEDILRHYDVTNKDCPHYYIKNNIAWETLKEEVERIINKDQAYAKAVEVLVKKGIIESPESWQEGNINLQYVPELITKIGLRLFDRKRYSLIVQKLVEIEVINKSSEQIWLDKKYGLNHVIWLIKKVSYYLEK